MPNQNDDLDNMSRTLVGNAANSDYDRLSVVAALINTFNYAVQVQGGRNQWDEFDAQSFSIALGAIDAIGQRHFKAAAEKPKARAVDQSRDAELQELEHFIRDTPPPARDGRARLAPNRFQ